MASPLDITMDETPLNNIRMSLPLRPRAKNRVKHLSRYLTLVLLTPACSRPCWLDLCGFISNTVAGLFRICTGFPDTEAL